MFCGSCGYQLPEGANVCPNCGTRVANESNFSSVKNNGQKVQMTNNVQSQVGRYKQKQVQKSERGIKDVRELFISADEEQKAVIGEEYLNTLTQTGILSKGFGVLTNRRIYYRGDSYYKSIGQYVNTNEDRIVDVRDITSSGFTYTRYTWLLILMLPILLWTLKLFTVEASTLFKFGLLGSYRVFGVDRLSNILLVLFLMVVSALLIVVYIFWKKTIYEITFGGDSLSIKISSYNIREVRAFDKVLHQVRDEYLAGCD